MWPTVGGIVLPGGLEASQAGAAVVSALVDCVAAAQKETQANDAAHYCVTYLGRHVLGGY